LSESISSGHAMNAAVDIVQGWGLGKTTTDWANIDIMNSWSIFHDKSLAMLTSSIVALLADRSNRPSEVPLNG